VFSVIPISPAICPNRKKRTKKQYVQESRRVSPIFPAGKLDPHERPDFLLVADRGKIGIEVTELCRQEPRAEAGRLAKVPDKAKAICDRFPSAEPVDVSIAFWRAETVSVNALTKSLADFIYANRAKQRPYWLCSCRRWLCISYKILQCILLIAIV
jgi:hypothetical protein